MDILVYALFLFFIGYVLARLDFPDNFDKSLHLFVLYVSLPATIFLQMPKLVFSIELLEIIALAWVAIAISFIFVFILTKIYTLSSEVKGALYLLVPLSNTSFLGIPIIEYFYGQGAIKYALVYDQFASFIGLSVFGSIVVAIYTNNGKVDILHISKKILVFPPFIALILSLFFDLDFKMLEPLSNTLLPLAMIAIGFRFKVKFDLLSAKLMLSIFPFKFLIIPIFLTFIFNVDTMMMKVAILESGMSSMISVATIVVLARLNSTFASTIIGYGVIVSLFTTTFLYYYLG
jgi:predicted permease